MYKALETSYFMDVSLFSISLFTVLEQLGIGRSSRVVAIIGSCRLDHCNSCIDVGWITERLGIGGSSRVTLQLLKALDQEDLGFRVFHLQASEGLSPEAVLLTILTSLPSITL
jgi:hypothetical protein